MRVRNIRFKSKILNDKIVMKIAINGRMNVVFDSESNGRNFSSLAQPCGEKKLFSLTREVFY